MTIVIKKQSVIFNSQIFLINGSKLQAAAELVGVRRSTETAGQVLGPKIGNVHGISRKKNVSD